MKEVVILLALSLLSSPVAFASQICSSFEITGTFEVRYLPDGKAKPVSVEASNRAGEFNFYRDINGRKAHEWTLVVIPAQSHSTNCVVYFGPSDLLGRAPKYSATIESGVLVLTEQTEGGDAGEAIVLTPVLR